MGLWNSSMPFCCLDAAALTQALADTRRQRHERLKDLKRVLAFLAVGMLIIVELSVV